jgi:hypothetical protein
MRNYGFGFQNKHKNTIFCRKSFFKALHSGDQTNLTEKFRGIFSVGNQINSVGFVGIIFQRPTLDKLRFFLPILFREK